MKPYLRTWAAVAVLLLALGMYSPVAADLVFYPSAVVKGTGHGTVLEILDLPKIPQVDFSSGCVKRIVSGDAFGGACPTDVFGNDQDNNQSTTRTPGELLSTTITPFTLAIVFNGSEPGNLAQESIQVDRLVLTFYDPADPVNTFISYSLPSPQFFEDASTGSGGAGFVFGFDFDQATNLVGWLQANSLVFTDVRLGLGSQLSLQDGHSYYYMAELTQPIPAPEPLSVGLVAAGLTVLGLLRRRSARTS